MPFKSKKQKTYLAINEPEVYKKFKKEDQNMDDAIANYKKAKKEHEKKLEREMAKKTKSQKRIEPETKYLPGIRSGIGSKVSPPARPGKAIVGRLKKGSKTTKRPIGGKVYKVDNKGQQLVAKQYGGKIHG